MWAVCSEVPLHLGINTHDLHLKTTFGTNWLENSWKIFKSSAYVA